MYRCGHPIYNGHLLRLSPRQHAPLHQERRSSHNLYFLSLSPRKYAALSPAGLGDAPGSPPRTARPHHARAHTTYVLPSARYTRDVTDARARPRDLATSRGVAASSASSPARAPPRSGGGGAGSATRARFPLDL